MLRIILSTLIMLLSVIIYAALSSAASFDCTKAADKIEKMICTNKELSRLDEELANTYKQTLGVTRDKKTLRVLQKLWLKDLKDWDKYLYKNCNKQECLIDFYRDRITWLAAYSDANFIALPHEIYGTYKAYDFDVVKIKPLTPILASVKMSFISNGYDCEFIGYGTWNGSKLVVAKYRRWNLRSCTVELTFRDETVATSAMDLGCKDYCGTNASLDRNILRKESLKLK